MPKHHGIQNLSKETWRRYTSTRDRVLKRMGMDELTNDEMVTLLLNVYDHHLETGEVV